jgi:hypothetical protein
VSTFVYVIGQSGAGDCFMKVGVADSPYSRLSQLQIGNPYPLDLMFSQRLPSRNAALAVEADAHSILADCHMSGEWFVCHYEDAIAAVREASAPRLVHG